MAIVSGDRTAERNYVTYALGITRIDMATGQRLGVQYLMLRKPFAPATINPGQSLGRVIQGAADGSEGTLQG